MQLAKDGRITLDLDETAKAHYISAQLESSHLRRKSHIQLSEEKKHDLTPSSRIELFIIQFGSLEPIVLSLMVQTPPLEIKHIVDIPKDDEEGWTVLTR